MGRLVGRAVSGDRDDCSSYHEYDYSRGCCCDDKTDPRNGSEKPSDGSMGGNVINYDCR